MKLFKRVASFTLACLLCLSTLCVLPVSAGDAVTVREGRMTQVVFGEVFTAADKGKMYSGNLYVETTLGPAYFDGVRNGDWFEFKINVEKAGDYHFCFSFGWVNATGTYSVSVDGGTAVKLQNSVQGINWRVKTLEKGYASSLRRIP